MRTQTTMAMIGLAFGGSLCAAGPLEWRLVPRDAAWVAHVDVERIASSKLMSSLPDGLEMDEDFGELREFGVDPRADVYSLTAYGWGSIEDERVVIVVEGSENLSAALARLAEREAEKVTRTEADGHVYYEVAEGHERHSIGVFDRDGGVRLIVAGSREGIDEAASRRSAERAPVVGDGPDDGSLVFASALDLDEVMPKVGGHNGHAQLVRATEGMTLDIGELDGRVHGRLVAAISDSQTAQDAAQLMQGVLAMGRMAMRDDEEMRPIVELASNVRIAAVESKLQITIDSPVDLVVEVLKSRAGHHGGGG